MYFWIVFCSGVILIYIKMSDNSHTLFKFILTFVASTLLYTDTFKTAFTYPKQLNDNKYDSRFTVMLQIKHYTLVYIWNVAYLFYGIKQTGPETCYKLLTPNRSTHYTEA